jgi:hypothetical protein
VEKMSARLEQGGNQALEVRGHGCSASEAGLGLGSSGAEGEGSAKGVRGIIGGHEGPFEVAI